jgi:hypothetical protein
MDDDFQKRATLCLFLGFAVGRALRLNPGKTIHELSLAVITDTAAIEEYMATIAAREEKPSNAE